MEVQPNSEDVVDLENCSDSMFEVTQDEEFPYQSPLRPVVEGLLEDNIRLEISPKDKNESRHGIVATPEVGMEYESWQQIDVHFRCYAKQNGFAVTRVGAGCRQKGGKLTKIYRNVTWKCEQYGQISHPNPGQPNTRAAAAAKLLEGSKDGEVDEAAIDKLSRKRETSAGYKGVRVAESKSKKCNYPVVLYASSSKEGIWTIKKVVLKHENHDPSPSKVRYISTYRQQEWNPAIRRRLLNDLECGISIPKIHRSLARERNGIENFPLTQRDLRNAAGKVQREKLKDGDANAMYAYLKRMSTDNDQFYHEIRLDEFGRLKDVMWVDARSRAAYEDFGDVVCFDSTYITNEYELPFANFVGVNHHGQTLLLGCALLSHEDSETFDWLFRTWLKCMGGKPPEGFLTDQDAAMRKSVENIMPESTHRWCIWHILQKFSKKLGAYDKYEEIKDELHNVIYDSLTPEEFEQSWHATIQQYNLTENKWLEDLYEERAMWIPTYLKHIFWAGKKTTQRSESINSFFDGFVNRRTRLYQFVQQYVNALEHRANDEKNANAISARYQKELVTTFPLEYTFRKFYTYGKFIDVHIECLKVLYVRPVKTVELEDGNIEITIIDRIWKLHKPSRREIPTEGRRKYTVRFNSNTKEAECVCKMFESHGLLCRHVIAVYDTYQVKDIPEKYILNRWRKDIKRKHTNVKVASYDPSKTEDVKRMDKLNVAFDPLCVEACSTDEDVEIVLEMIRKAHELIVERRANAVASGSGENTTTTPPNLTTTPQLTGHVEVNDNDGLLIVPAQATPGENGSGILCSTDSDTMPNIGDPPLKKKVGRKKEKRFQSCVEKPPSKPRKKTKAQDPPNSVMVEQQHQHLYPPYVPYPQSYTDQYLQFPGAPNHFHNQGFQSSPQYQYPSAPSFGYDGSSYPPSTPDMVFVPGIGYIPRGYGRYGPIPDWYYRDCVPYLASQQQSNGAPPSTPSSSSNPFTPSVGTTPAM